MVITIYFSGKISSNSIFGTSYWRNDICAKLSKLSNIEIIKLDPLDRDCDESDSKFIVGKNSNHIKNADFVILYLTDDISFGASAETVIAKYFKTPVIGIAKEGKFIRSQTVRQGQVINNWIHPYVDIFCDIIVNDLNGVAKFINNFNRPIKDLSVITDCIEHFEKNRV